MQGLDHIFIKTNKKRKKTSLTPKGKEKKKARCKDWITYTLKQINK